MIENNHHQPETSKEMLSLMTESRRPIHYGQSMSLIILTFPSQTRDLIEIQQEPPLPMPGTAIKHLHQTSTLNINHLLKQK